LLLRRVLFGGNAQGSDELQLKAIDDFLAEPNEAADGGQKEPQRRMSRSGFLNLFGLGPKEEQEQPEAPPSEVSVIDSLVSHRMSRRGFFKLGGKGAAGVAVGATLASGGLGFLAGETVSASSSRTSLGDIVILKGVAVDPSPLPEGGLWYLDPTKEYRVSDGLVARDLIYEIQKGGVVVGPRPKLNFDNFLLTDNVGASRIDIKAIPNFSDLVGVIGAAQHGADILADTYSPATLTADVNDYSVSAAGLVRVASDAQRSITGILAAAYAKLISLRNVGSFNIVLANLNGGSSGPNQIVTGIGADMILPPGQSADLWYDITSAKWQVAA
jgi:hypothetical protein